MVRRGNMASPRLPSVLHLFLLVRRGRRQSCRMLALLGRRQNTRASSLLMKSLPTLTGNSAGARALASRVAGLQDTATPPSSKAGHDQGKTRVEFRVSTEPPTPLPVQPKGVGAALGQRTSCRSRQKRGEQPPPQMKA